MSNAMEFIVERLPEVTADDIRRRFSTVEIRDEKVFAAELQQYVLESVSVLAQGLPDDLFSVGEAPYKPVGLIGEFPPTARAAALRRDLSRKADALVATEPWQPSVTDLQRGRAILVEAFNAPSNMSVQDFAKLAGKVRQQIYEDIKARRLLTISIGPRKQKVPEWQLDQAKLALTRSVLAAAPAVGSRCGGSSVMPITSVSLAWTAPAAEAADSSAAIKLRCHMLRSPSPAGSGAQDRGRAAGCLARQAAIAAAAPRRGLHRTGTERVQRSAAGAIEAWARITASTSGAARASPSAMAAA